MNILPANSIDRAAWSRLVKTSATGTWFQTPEAYDFFASMPDLFQPFVIGVASDRHILRAVCTGYVTKEKNPVKQFFMRRAIILGGPCLADDCTEQEVELLMKRVKEFTTERKTIAPIYIETRNFNDYSKWKDSFAQAGFTYNPHLNYHVDCTDETKMWEHISENRKRQIRKANELGVSRFVENEQEVREWYKILERLYKTKVKTPLWPLEFFIEAYRQGIGQFLLVRYAGKIIGGSMVVTDGKCVYEWFECGLNSEYKEQYPSVIATWEGMKYALEQRIARYDMMGAGEPGVPYGVRDFKSEFGGAMVEHGRFLHVAKPILYRIGVAGVKILKVFKSEGV